MKGTFVAVDFETADSGADSACALGLVTCSNGKVVDRQLFMIRPPRPLFLFTSIHGISWDMVKDKPTFRDHWPQIKKTLDEADFLAAHNASFDRRVMEACAGSALGERRWVCTVQLARKTWNIRPTKLNNVCDFLDIDLNHHEALSDADACARIVLSAQKAERLQETAR